MISIVRLKSLLTIDELDVTEDSLLSILKEHSQWRIKGYLKLSDTDEFPAVLDWVADEVTAKRYNKLSAEGLLSEGISGITHKFEADFLQEFYGVLDNYVLYNMVTTKGRMVML